MVRTAPLRALLVACCAFGFAPRGPATARLPPPRSVSSDSLLELPLASVDGAWAWLDGFCTSNDAVTNAAMPLFVQRNEAPTVQLRFTAKPDEGIDLQLEPPGAASPFGRVVLSRVGRRSDSAQWRSLLRDAEARVVRGLVADASQRKLTRARSMDTPPRRDADAGRAPPASGGGGGGGGEASGDRGPVGEPQLDKGLYRGDYGPGFKEAAMDLFESVEREIDAPGGLFADDAPADGDDEAFKSMFSRGAEIARRAAGGLPKEKAAVVAEPKLDSYNMVDDEHVLMDVSFEGTGLKGGIDIFAGPAKLRGLDAIGLAEKGEDDLAAKRSTDLTGVSVERVARFAVLVREVQGAPDGDRVSMICDAYRDVLLDDAFGALARRALASCPGAEEQRATAVALELINRRIVDLVTELAELAAFAEAQHLETVRLLCDEAKARGANGLRAAASTFRVRLEDDFVAYLAYAADKEASQVRRKGGDPVRDPSEWLLVLDSVRTAVFAELARDVDADVDAVRNILALPAADTRRALLRINLQGMGPRRLARFEKSVQNILSNLLDNAQTATPDSQLRNKLVQLRADFEDLLPDFKEQNRASVNIVQQQAL
ncbi:hypothetical protein M885DRAFT_509487 [Pelagophyceae sp. CCMP2097]|nr:hypothetical protein M885DRAFT_509487 [Pelagophyceae sp. CCMP2097]